MAFQNLLRTVLEKWFQNTMSNTANYFGLYFSKYPPIISKTLFWKTLCFTNTFQNAYSRTLFSNSEFWK